MLLGSAIVTWLFVFTRLRHLTAKFIFKIETVIFMEKLERCVSLACKALDIESALHFLVQVIDT